MKHLAILLVIITPLCALDSREKMCAFKQKELDAQRIAEHEKLIKETDDNMIYFEKAILKSYELNSENLKKNIKANLEHLETMVYLWPRRAFICSILLRSI